MSPTTRLASRTKPKTTEKNLPKPPQAMKARKVRARKREPATDSHHTDVAVEASTAIAEPTTPSAESLSSATEVPDSAQRDDSLSGLDAAAQVLRQAGEPLPATILVQRMIDGGLWRTKGRTPAATIYAAIIREIRAKGAQARFQKVDRGRFVAI